MSQVAQYLLTVLTAALATSIIEIIIGKKSAVSSIISVICGLFLSITVMSPLIEINVPDPQVFFSSISVDSNAITESAVKMAQSSQNNIITQKVTAYVLEKAQSLNLDISVRLSLSEGSVSIPEEIHISGLVSPFAKKQLSLYISEQLGIPEERQIWS